MLSFLAVHFYIGLLLFFFFFPPDSLTFNKEICSFYSLLRYSIDPFAHLWRWKVRWFVGRLGKFLVYLRFYSCSQDSEEIAQAVKAECQQKGVCVCFGGVGNIMGGFIMTSGFWKQERETFIIQIDKISQILASRDSIYLSHHLLCWGNVMVWHRISFLSYIGWGSPVKSEKL